MAVLDIQKVRKYYGKIKAVDGIDLKTEEGELLALLGSSGSGKSTLMRMIAGLEQPTEGDILIDDNSVVGIPPRNRNVAMVFQSYALYPHMSVRENIVFPLKCHRIPKDTWPKRLQWAISVLGIEHLMDRRPGRLSGGEKQRVALARALVRDPELFIFDEPLSALDAQVRNVARSELRDVHERTGITTLYVTHDQLEALGLGDRVVVMSKGRIRQLGTPEELYAKPADLFVASFIGNPPMNLIDRGERILGVRAEHLVYAKESHIVDSGLTLTLRIHQMEFLGSEWLAYGYEKDRDDQSQIVVRVSPDLGEKIKPDDVLDFEAEKRHVKIFDATSEKLIDDGSQHQH